MGIFSNFNKKSKSDKKGTVVSQASADRMLLANMVLDSISDGVIIVNSENLIQMINPAAASMVGYVSQDIAVGVNIAGVLRFENGEGVPIEDSANEILGALVRNESFTTRNYVLVNAQNQRKALSITVTPAKTGHGEKIISFRDITKELEEEGEQTEFISTASHEMRTPVASIEGYLGLALNPQCATIDDRAKKYLEEAHASSQHLGRLFKDLLDVTKLDDKKARLHMIPVEMVDLVRQIVDGQIPAMGEKNLKFTFGSNNGMGSGSSSHAITQAAYSLIDVDFLREILNNLIENAIKYTKESGAIWVNVRGDGDRVLINITDTGIGISPDDLLHIFQKFYRVDNSQTREIGGTGLGLYIVKMRTEAMGGKVWAESSFGEGSTFYLSFPRLTFEEYERRKQIQKNTDAMKAAPTTGVSPVETTPAHSGTAGAPISLSTVNPEQVAPTPQPQPAQSQQPAQPPVQPQPQPQPQPAQPPQQTQPQPPVQPQPQPAQPQSPAPQSQPQNPIAPPTAPSPGDGIIKT